ANPMAKGVNPDLPKLLHDEIFKNMSYLFLFRNEIVKNPDPVKFKHIHQSYIKELLQPEKGGAAFELPEGVVVPAGGKDKKKVFNRNGWRPVRGTIAEAAIGGGGVGIRLGKDMNPGAGSTEGPVRQARTEFVILIVWKVQI